MGDFLAFRRMVTPVIIQIIFWLGVAACVIMGLATMAMGVGVLEGRSGNGPDAGGFIAGVAIIVGGTLMVRIYCEILILFFRMNETLTDIKNNLERPPQAMMHPQVPYSVHSPQ